MVKWHPSGKLSGLMILVFQKQVMLQSLDLKFRVFLNKVVTWHLEKLSELKLLEFQKKVALQPSEL